MAYQKNEASYSEQQLRSDNPNVSFPRNALANAQIRSDYGVTEVDDPVVESETPAVLDDKEGFKVVDGEYVELTWKEKRVLAYGPVAGQIEFITENGLTPWQQRGEEIKQQYPKE